jgi:hypothetical protein
MSLLGWFRYAVPFTGDPRGASVGVRAMSLLS